MVPFWHTNYSSVGTCWASDLRMEDATLKSSLSLLCLRYHRKHLTMFHHSEDHSAQVKKKVRDYRIIKSLHRHTGGNLWFKPLSRNVSFWTGLIYKDPKTKKKNQRTVKHLIKTVHVHEQSQWNTRLEQSSQSTESPPTLASDDGCSQHLMPKRPPENNGWYYTVCICIFIH